MSLFSKVCSSPFTKVAGSPFYTSTAIGAPWYTLGKADGVDPTLWADFANDRYMVNNTVVPFSDVFTFTRASTATYFNSSGVMQTAAVNTRRIDYNPATLVSNGLLMEEQRTNICKYSKTPFTDWLVLSSTRTAAASDFLGYFTNGAVIASTGSIWNGLAANNLNWTSGTLYSWTLFVKAGTSNKVRIYIRNNSAGVESVLDGTVGGVLTATDNSAGAITYTNFTSVDGGYIYTGTFTANATTTGGRVFISPASVVVGETIILYGFQLEAGAFPTSFIETTTAAVTRSPENSHNSAANVVPTSAWANATAETIYAEINQFGPSAGGRITDPHPSSAGSLLIRGTVLAEAQWPPDGLITQAVGSLNVDEKWAAAHATNSMASSINGSLQTDSSLTYAARTAMSIGNRTTLDRPLNGSIKEFRVYPIRALNATLQTLTT